MLPIKGAGLTLRSLRYFMELEFTCAICGATFPADPDTMLEVQTGVALINDQEIPMDIKVLANDHDYSGAEPTLSGDYGICMCKKCQNDITNETPKN